MLDDENENQTDAPSQEASGQDAVDDLFGSFPQGDAAQDAAGGDAEKTDSQGPAVTMGRSRVEELDAVYDVPVQISAVLGRAVMPVNNLLKLGRGAVVQLDKRVGEAIEIFVNNKLVARGEVVVVDERLGITMTEIIKSDRSS